MKLSFFGAAHAVTGSCHCLGRVPEHQGAQLFSVNGPLSVPEGAKGPLQAFL